MIRPARRRSAGVVALAFVLLVALLSGCAATSAAAPGTDAGPSTSARATKGASGLPTVAAADLPPEARRTLTLIAAGGPFPYSKDGVVFGNRERLLPARPSGYYQEYTVVTPGSSDRGARRIVAGPQGERFYSDDHYASFREVTG